VPVVRLKLRPDTPQLYENFVFDRIQVDDAQAIFDVKPWTQFFDLQGHQPPRSVVRHLAIRNLSGTLRSLGELRGNQGDLLENISLENLALSAGRGSLRIGTVHLVAAVLKYACTEARPAAYSPLPAFLQVLFTDAVRARNFLRRRVTGWPEPRQTQPRAA